MNLYLLDVLACPRCGAHPLHEEAFEMYADDEILHGVLVCQSCNSWFPIKDCLLELLVEPLFYESDRLSFYEQFSRRLNGLGLLPPAKSDQDKSAFSEQFKQQTHFDWYANNERQTYSEYENTPFWKAADEVAFAKWRAEIRPNRYLLDVGCAQGRSTFKIMDLGLKIIAFDISKVLVAQAIERYHRINYNARALFFVADGSRFPVLQASIDYLMIYGVLHHLPDPEATCQEISRVLKPGGVYFGQENNQSFFRVFFDALQSLFPIWHEEAGTEPLISNKKLLQWFSRTNLEIQAETSVFLPPHLLNAVGDRYCGKLLRASDRIAQAIPILRDNGGIILIRGLKK